MPIKNYTTTIDPGKTAADIVRILSRFKAKRIQQEFDDDGDLKALSFSVTIDGVELGYRLPARPDEVHKALKRDSDVPPRYCTPEHAKRVAWRIVKDWIDAQLAMIEAGGATVDEIFFPYLLVDGQTIIEKIARGGGMAALAAGGQLLLGEGGDP